MKQVSHPEPTWHERSTRDKLGRVFEAGQRLISSRFDLLSLEMKQTASGALKTGLLTSTGGVMLLLAHIAGMIAAALGIALVLPAWAAVLIVAGIQFVIGWIVMLVGLGQTHKPAPGISPEQARPTQRRLPSQTTGQPVERPRLPSATSLVYQRT
jgi:hypothetical protein